MEPSATGGPSVPSGGPDGNGRPTATGEKGPAGSRGLPYRAVGFLRRLSPGFTLMLVRRALHGLASNLSVQYNSIFATALGANPVQLGSLQSVGNAFGAVVAVPAGWVIDSYGLRRVFLVGTVLLVASNLLYFWADQWMYLYPAIILFYMGTRITCTCCTVTCATELRNDQRATGRGLCRSLSSVVALATPMLAAWAVSSWGGVNAEGIRPLYAVRTGIFAAILVLLAVLVRGRPSSTSPGVSRSLFTDFAEVFKHGPDTLRLMLMIALMDLPWSMTQPFSPLFAHQYKAADEFVLGGIAVAGSFATLLAAIPLGRLADRRGRKRCLFLIAPLAYGANLCLVFAPGPSTLLLSGLLFGFNSISMGIALAMAAEVVPKSQMGRWTGAISLVRGLVSIPAPLLGGMIWDHVGPIYVFFTAIAIDVVLRLPLLASMRETLHLDMEDAPPSDRAGGGP